jgi:hypothetical protein
MVLMQEPAAAIALAAGSEGPEHLKDAEARLKKLDKELQEERQCVLELPPYFYSRHISTPAKFQLPPYFYSRHFFCLIRTASFSSQNACVADTAALSNSCGHEPRSS